MRKILSILFILLILVGCSNKKSNHINTIIEENKNRIAINYPITNNKRLDNDIFLYIKNTKKNFKTKYNNIFAELNIDYKYNLINDKYINILLITYIYSKETTSPIIQYKTYLFDIEKNNYINLLDIVDNKNKFNYDIKKELIKLDKNNNFNIYDNFFIDDNITVYFPDNKNYYEIILNTNEYININDICETKEYENIISTNKTIDINKPVLALTFDDGPSKYTNEILDILNKHGANATFFVLGNKIDIYSETINKMHKQGNEIGNHSYNHKWLTKLNNDELLKQINDTQNIIKKITNFTPTVMRPTYGSINSSLRKNIDLDIIMWDVDSNDWKLKNSKKIANRIIGSVKDLDIILMHDTYSSTKEAVKIIIPKLIEEGYQFVTVSELKEIKLLRDHKNE